MKKTITIISTIIFVILGFMFAIKTFYPPIETYTIVSEYNDEFLIKAKLATIWPEKKYYLEYYHKDTVNPKEPILRSAYAIKKPESINGYYRDSNVRCYKIDSRLLFSVEGENRFRKKSIYRLSDLEPDNYKFFIPVAKKLIKHPIYANHSLIFLAKSNDTESVNILKRHINGNLAEDEIEFYKLTKSTSYYEWILSIYNSSE